MQHAIDYLEAELMRLCRHINDDAEKIERLKLELSDLESSKSEGFRRTSEIEAALALLKGGRK